tara:strand:- start:6077 stop:6859 length:783 start_codon:yes stop_codon:yes gene_type:complete
MDKNEMKPTKFACEKCMFYTNSHNKYNIHLKTKKHQKLEGCLLYFQCPSCYKYYKTRQALYYHTTNSCKDIENKVEKIIETNNEILKTNKQLLKENEEIKTQLKNTKTTQQINNNFNLNIYLNETCKDAINLSDFIKQINVESEDLNTVMSDGVEKSIVHVMVTALKTLEEYQRPIQCTDLKREIVYVKDENIWEKDKDKKILTNAIYKIRDKHLKSLVQTDTSMQDEYIEMHQKVLADIRTKKISSQILNEAAISKIIN